MATCAKEHSNLWFVVSNRGSDTDAISYTFQFLSDCPSRQSDVKWKSVKSSKACPVSDKLCFKYGCFHIYSVVVDKVKITLSPGLNQLNLLYVSFRLFRHVFFKRSSGV